MSTRADREMVPQSSKSHQVNPFLNHIDGMTPIHGDKPRNNSKEGYTRRQTKKTRILGVILETVHERFSNSRKKHEEPAFRSFSCTVLSNNDINVC